MKSLEPVLASIENLIEYIPLLIPITAILMVPVVIGIILYIKHRREQLWHETARIALEKGQPLPPNLMDPRFSSIKDPVTGTVEVGPHGVKPPARDIRSGLLMLAIGSALLYADRSGHFGGPMGTALAGMIVGGIGLARLLFGAGVLLFSRKDSPKL